MVTSQKGQEYKHDDHWNALDCKCNFSDAFARFFVVFVQFLFSWSLLKYGGVLKFCALLNQHLFFLKVKPITFRDEGKMLPVIRSVQLLTRLVQTRHPRCMLSGAPSGAPCFPPPGALYAYHAIAEGWISSLSWHLQRHFHRRRAGLQFAVPPSVKALWGCNPGIVSLLAKHKQPDSKANNLKKKQKKKTKKKNCSIIPHVSAAYDYLFIAVGVYEHT